MNAMKLLIVEDEKTEREALHLILNKLYPDHVEISEAVNGAEAVSIALSARPDLILMDINLPLMDGLTAAGKIRAQYPEVAIIMISAYSDYDHLRSSMREHALDYIIKPYSQETLKEAIDRTNILNKPAQTFGKKATIENTKNFILAHYKENIMMKEIAESVSLDKSYLGRLFKNETGVTVMDFLRSTRINKAKRLLAQGMNPGTVAEETGFGDSAYFSKSFKDITGMTPTEYSRQCRD